MELGGKPLGVLFETKGFRVMRAEGMYKIFIRKTDEFGAVYWAHHHDVVIDRGGFVLELIETIARRVD